MLRSSPPEVTDAERAAITEAVKHVTELKAWELSAETHEMSRAWKGTRNGEVLDVSLDAMDDLEYEQMRARADESTADLDKVFGLAGRPTSSG